MRTIPAGIAAFAALAVLIRWTVKDAIPVASTIFYGTPPMVISLLFIGCSGAWLLLQRHRLAMAAAAVSIAAALWSAAATRHSNPPVGPGPDDLTAYFADVGHESGFECPEADIVGLVESEGGMLLLAQGKVVPLTVHSLDGRGRAGVAGFGRLTIVLVDLFPHPLKSRRPAFDARERLLAPLAGKPVLILGDFNTPRDSVHFQSWRASRTHAFEATGQGIGSTWPAPVPVICIDHVWGSGLRFVRCDLENGPADHRGLRVRFRIEY